MENKENPKKNLDEFKKIEGKIDAIKEIIFGKDIADYNEHFQKIDEQLNLLSKSLNERSDKLDEKFTDLTNQLKTEFEKSIEQLSNKTEKSISNLDEKKANRKELGKMLISMGEKLAKD